MPPSQLADTHMEFASIQDVCGVSACLHHSWLIHVWCSHPLREYVCFHIGLSQCAYIYPIFTPFHWQSVGHFFIHYFHSIVFLTSLTFEFFPGRKFIALSQVQLLL